MCEKYIHIIIIVKKKKKITAHSLPCSENTCLENINVWLKKNLEKPIKIIVLFFVLHFISKLLQELR